MEKIINYQGTRPKISSLSVHPGQETDDQFQPWHCLQFSDFASLGIELCFEHEDVTVGGQCPPPFKRIADDYYQLDMDLTLKTQPGCSLLVLPHHRHYTHGAPLPLPCLWETDWWPYPLSVIFKGEGRFVKGEPFAQAVVLQRHETSLSEMTEAMKKRNGELIEQISQGEYITREWTTRHGTKLDNLYNVLSNKSFRKRKFRII